ncbi:MAG: methionyl-tRNA formyltransferase [Clostridia bacterium]|jgi:methionyl-tRNA formyltransferase|nr:methionyl-tRNA formyltransferase [Clostridia bacterium]
MRIVFMGTPDFARDSLKALVEAGHKIELVVTNPDKPKGRGMKMIPSEVKEYAITQGFELEQPMKVRKNEELYEKIKNINPDIICVVAYGKIIPKEILDLPKFGCINVHGSLLPKYRGAAPIQWAVINGDKETGVTTMFMDEGMDTGDMLLKEVVEIGENETTGELWDRLSAVGANLLVETLKQIEDGSVKREKQSDDFSLAPMLDREIAKIDWKNKSVNEIKNLVRGLNPFMGAYSFFNEKKLKFWKVECADKQCDKEPGEVICANSKEGLFIAGTDGIVSVLEIQGENAKKMCISDYLRGNKIDIGEKFK